MTVYEIKSRKVIHPSRSRMQKYEQATDRRNSFKKNFGMFQKVPRCFTFVKTVFYFLSQTQPDFSVNGP